MLPRGKTVGEDCGLWSGFATPSDAEGCMPGGCSRTPGRSCWLLVMILQERQKVDGGVERGRDLADEMAGREDERPRPRGWRRPGPCRAGP